MKNVELSPGEYFAIGTKYNNVVGLRVCGSEPGGPVVEMRVWDDTGDDESAALYPAMTKKQARKLALALLSWTESYD